MNDVPTHLKAGDLRCFDFRVVDADTGQPIDRVVEADTETGKLTRLAIEDGNLVRDGDRFKMIEETRPIRFEPIAPAAPAAAATPDGADAVPLDLSEHQVLPPADAVAG